MKMYWEVELQVHVLSNQALARSRANLNLSPQDTNRVSG
jgi:hypothetical protein